MRILLGPAKLHLNFPNLNLITGLQALRRKGGQPRAIHQGAIGAAQVG